MHAAHLLSKTTEMAAITPNHSKPRVVAINHGHLTLFPFLNFRCFISVALVPLFYCQFHCIIVLSVILFIYSSVISLFFRLRSYFRSFFVSSVISFIVPLYHCPFRYIITISDIPLRFLSYASSFRYFILLFVESLFFQLLH